VSVQPYEPGVQRAAASNDTVSTLEPEIFKPLTLICEADDPDDVPLDGTTEAASTMKLDVPSVRLLSCPWLDDTLSEKPVVLPAETDPGARDALRVGAAALAPVGTRAMPNSTSAAVTAALNERARMLVRTGILPLLWFSWAGSLWPAPPFGLRRKREASPDEGQASIPQRTHDATGVRGTSGRYRMGR
jgi:hypothetical protein